MLLTKHQRLNVALSYICMFLNGYKCVLVYPVCVYIQIWCFEITIKTNKPHKNTIPTNFSKNFFTYLKRGVAVRLVDNILGSKRTRFPSFLSGCCKPFVKILERPLFSLSRLSRTLGMIQIKVIIFERFASLGQLITVFTLVLHQKMKILIEIKRAF